LSRLLLWRSCSKVGGVGERVGRVAAGVGVRLEEVVEHREVLRLAAGRSRGGRLRDGFGITLYRGSRGLWRSDLDVGHDGGGRVGGGIGREGVEVAGGVGGAVKSVEAGWVMAAITIATTAVSVKRIESASIGGGYCCCGGLAAERIEVRGGWLLTSKGIRVVGRQLDGRVPGEHLLRRVLRW